MFRDVFCKLFELDFNESLLWNILVGMRACFVFYMLERAIDWTIRKIDRRRRRRDMKMEGQQKSKNVIGFH